MASGTSTSWPPFHCVFLDTNIVWYLTTLPGFYFDAVGDEETDKLSSISSERLRDDIEALRYFPPLFDRGIPHGVALSESVLEELSSIDTSFGEELLRWSREMEFIDSYTPRSFFQGLADALDPKDRVLYLQAAALGCDAFLTTDYRTIVARRTCLPRWGPRVITPTEWLDDLRPWLGAF